MKNEKIRLTEKQLSEILDHPGLPGKFKSSLLENIEKRKLPNCDLEALDKEFEELYKNGVQQGEENIKMYLEKSNQIVEEDKKEIESFLLKKGKRINLWVSDQFYDDVQTLLRAYPNYSQSEMIIEIVNEKINIAKDDELWETLTRFSEAEKRRKELFKK